MLLLAASGQLALVNKVILVDIIADILMNLTLIKQLVTLETDDFDLHNIMPT